MSTTTPHLTLRLPPSCRLSHACDPSGKRQALSHAYLHRRDDALWLLATDSFIAVAFKMPNSFGIAEGFVPIEALRLMETGLAAERVSETAWRVKTDHAAVTFDLADTLRPDDAFPAEKLARYLWGEWHPEALAAIGLDPALTDRIAAALGANSSAERSRWGVRLAFSGATKPIRVTSLDSPSSEAFGVQMPCVIQP